VSGEAKERATAELSFGRYAQPPLSGMQQPHGATLGRDDQEDRGELLHVRRLRPYLDHRQKDGRARETRDASDKEQTASRVVARPVASDVPGPGLALGDLPKRDHQVRTQDDCGLYNLCRIVRGHRERRGTG